MATIPGPCYNGWLQCCFSRNFLKYSELKLGDSISETFVEKEDLSAGFSNEEAKEKE